MSNVPKQNQHMQLPSPDFKPQGIFFSNNELYVTVVGI